MITFRGRGAEQVLPPTSSHEVGVVRQAALRTGGRTPLALGLRAAVTTIATERRRDPRRRPLLIVVTDGRATGGPDPALGWAQIKRDLAAETYRFYVLDEFTYPMKWGWVDVADVIATLRDRPGTQHVVITGRDAHPDLIGAADLVTEMAKVKHPMDAGRKGQQGIEW
jgi:ATP:corrinoid adenosyltransferase